MLSREDNELLTQIGPGTAMGNLMRQYWMPIYLSSDLPENDSKPERMKLLHEDLIIFRDSEGRVGLVTEVCPHRGASLYWSRNEKGGLRCVYHGWMYDATGRCVDMPNEPPYSNFKDKVRLKAAYPCVERNGVVWTYMGPRETPPPLPDLEFNMLAPEHIAIRRDLQDDLRAIFLELTTTVIIVTHDIGEAGFFGDTIFLMQDGKILQRGTLEDLVRRPEDEFVSTFINAQRSPLESVGG